MDHLNKLYARRTIFINKSTRSNDFCSPVIKEFINEFINASEVPVV